MPEHPVPLANCRIGTAPDQDGCVPADATRESKLFAQVVTLGPLDSGVQHVGWSADGADGDHLIVMRGPEDNDCCLVTRDGTASAGVLSFTVEQEQTCFVLTAEAASAIGVAPMLTLRYARSAVNEVEIRTALLELVGVEPPRVTTPPVPQ
jgi:hypothetical protein